ncbi:mCG1038218, isoform CRA_a, partial [Mus musculus]
TFRSSVKRGTSAQPRKAGKQRKFSHSDCSLSSPEQGCFSPPTPHQELLNLRVDDFKASSHRLTWKRVQLRVH